MAKYEVIGTHTVDGVAPGGTVELSDVRAAQLIAGEHVKKKTARRKAEAETTTEVDD